MSLNSPSFQGACDTRGMPPDMYVIQLCKELFATRLVILIQHVSFTSKGLALGLRALDLFLFQWILHRLQYVRASVVSFEFIAWNTCTCALCTDLRRQSLSRTHDW